MTVAVVRRASWYVSGDLSEIPASMEGHALLLIKLPPFFIEGRVIASCISISLVTCCLGEGALGPSDQRPESQQLRT